LPEDKGVTEIENSDLIRPFEEDGGKDGFIPNGKK
jgi:hypothetical protein